MGALIFIQSEGVKALNCFFSTIAYRVSSPDPAQLSSNSPGLQLCGPGFVTLIVALPPSLSYMIRHAAACFLSCTLTDSAVTQTLL